MESGAASGISPTMPLPVLLAGTAVFMVLLLLCLRQARGLVTAFVLVAFWLRAVSNSFHTYTFAPVVGGLSLNALITVAIIGFGALCVPYRTLFQRWTIPIYGFLSTIVISTLINGTGPGGLDMLLKWLYVLIMIAAISAAMAESRADRVLLLLSICLAPPFVLQFLSVALGVSKATESDGSTSYIGGYFHEAAFSMMILTALVCWFLSRRLSFATKLFLCALSVSAILLANYRTAMLAALPIIVGLFVLEGVSQFDRKSRSFAAIMVIALVMLVLGAGAEQLQERFADLFKLVFESERYFRPTAEFAEQDKKLLSGRLYIWVSYFEGYLSGKDLQLVFGSGPNAWQGVFPKYAHNTLVSILFELGIAGVLWLLAIWATFWSATLRIADPLTRNKILLAQIGFLILNQATMPHWNVEGNMFFCVLQGYLLFRIGEQAVSHSRLQLMPYR